jgi:hypothetical protein
MKRASLSTVLTGASISTSQAKAGRNQPAASRPAFHAYAQVVSEVALPHIHSFRQDCKKSGHNSLRTCSTAAAEPAVAATPSGANQTSWRLQCHTDGIEPQLNYFRRSVRAHSYSHGAPNVSPCACAAGHSAARAVYSRSPRTLAALWDAADHCSIPAAKPSYNAGAWAAGRTLMAPQRLP